MTRKHCHIRRQWAGLLASAFASGTFSDAMVQWHSALRNNGGLQLRDSSRFSRDSLLASPFFGEEPRRVIVSMYCCIVDWAVCPFRHRDAKIHKSFDCANSRCHILHIGPRPKELKSVFLLMILSARYRCIKQSILR